MDGDKNEGTEEAGFSDADLVRFTIYPVIVNLFGIASAYGARLQARAADDYLQSLAFTTVLITFVIGLIFAVWIWIVRRLLHYGLPLGRLRWHFLVAVPISCILFLFGALHALAVLSNSL